MNRFFTQKQLQVAQSVVLEPAIAQHAVRVLRLKPGAQIELVDSTQQLVQATITATEPLTVQVDAALTQTVELPIRVHILCGVPKGDKAEWLVQKVTELGVSAVTFFNARWGTAKWAEPRQAKKIARLQAIAQGAAEQSHRLVVPTIAFADWPGVVETVATARLVAYEETAKAGERGQLVATVAQHPAELAAVFGPEGGLHPDEIAALTEAGWALAGLGPRIMRAETAPLYLLSAVSALSELQGEDS